MPQRPDHTSYLWDDILQCIPAHWVTTKALANIVGVSWQRIHLLLPRMVDRGEIDSRDESFIASKSRIRHRMQYRRRQKTPSDLEELFGIAPISHHDLTGINVTRHFLDG